MISILITLPAGIVSIVALYLLLRSVMKLEVASSSLISGTSLCFLYGLLSIVFSSEHSIAVDVVTIHLALYIMSAYVLYVIGSNRKAATIVNANKEEAERKFRAGPASIIIFFMIVFTSDAFYIYLATAGLDSSGARNILPETVNNSDVESYFPGTVTHDFRQRENQYNDYKLQRAEQDKLGWNVNLGWKNDAIENSESVLLLSVLDKHGDIINSAQVTGSFIWPGNNKHDQNFVMQQNESGVYQAKVVMSKAGKWNVVIDIHSELGSYEIRATTTVN